MSNITIKEREIEEASDSVENMIYEIRGVQVMLSSDVAKLYQVETRRINEIIKRNIKRFPDTFCFQLTEVEFYNLRSQFAISKENNHGVRMDKSVIEMTNNQDLRKMYKLMQIEFASEFDEIYKHTFGEGWSLCPIIGENVVIEIDSDNSMDKNWFYEQSHKKIEENSPKNKTI